jgi:hypothetical protein
MRLGRVVEHQVGDHPDTPGVRLVQQVHEVLDTAELRQHGTEVTDVVTAVPQGRRVERRQPEAVHAEPLEVVQFAGQTTQVAGAVAVGVVEGTDEDLVEHGALEPRGLAGCLDGRPEVVRLWFDEHSVRGDGLAGVRHAVKAEG